jgi:glycosyltransferase involved in cell wall biosynthesis
MIDRTSRKPLRVAIDAPMTSGGQWGGIEQFVMSLVHALGKLKDGNEEYLILVHQQNPNWLDSYLGRNQRVLINPATGLDRMKAWLGPLRKPLGRLFRLTKRTFTGDVPTSNGFYESLGVDVIHFPHHAFVRCNLPTIYSPHDLQHVHYPQFFLPEDLTIREAVIRSGCHESFAVTVDAQWTKDDIVRQYKLAPEKVWVIRLGAPTALYFPLTDQQSAQMAHKFQLPSAFAFYPAQTWEHKNHIRLLEAIALLREREGLVVNLVCTGKQNQFWPRIQARLAGLGLENQVRFLGFVSSGELRALYHLAQFVIHPSLFEGGGLPVLEAFREGVALACSSATSLPEYAGDAALLFDPQSIESIAYVLKRMSQDADLRAELIRRGTVRVRQFSWEQTARAYRALYRRAAGHILSDEEEGLLQNCT